MRRRKRKEKHWSLSAKRGRNDFAYFKNVLVWRERNRTRMRTFFASRCIILQTQVRASLHRITLVNIQQKLNVTFLTFYTSRDKANTYFEMTFKWSFRVSLLCLHCRWEKTLVHSGHVALVDKHFPTRVVFSLYFDPATGRTSIRLTRHFLNK